MLAVNHHCRADQQRSSYSFNGITVQCSQPCRGGERRREGSVDAVAARRTNTIVDGNKLRPQRRWQIHSTASVSEAARNTIHERLRTPHTLHTSSRTLTLHAADALATSVQQLWQRRTGASHSGSPRSPSAEARTGTSVHQARSSHPPATRAVRALRRSTLGMCQCRGHHHGRRHCHSHLYYLCSPLERTGKRAREQSNERQVTANFCCFHWSTVPPFACSEAQATAATPRRHARHESKKQ